MRCTDQHGVAGLFPLLLGLLAACGSPQVPVAAPPPVQSAQGGQGAQQPATQPKVAVAPQLATKAPRQVQLAAPATPRSMQDLQLQFARRLVAAHPDTSYSTRAPDRLWAIPVLEVELNADGSVRRIDVLRKPTTGNEATALAITAVRRAAPRRAVWRRVAAAQTMEAGRDLSVRRQPALQAAHAGR